MFLSFCKRLRHRNVYFSHNHPYKENILTLIFQSFKWTRNEPRVPNHNCIDLEKLLRFTKCFIRNLSISPGPPSHNLQNINASDPKSLHPQWLNTIPISTPTPLYITPPPCWPWTRSPRDWRRVAVWYYASPEKAASTADCDPLLPGSVGAHVGATGCRRELAAAQRIDCPTLAPFKRVLVNFTNCSTYES